MAGKIEKFESFVLANEHGRIVRLFSRTDGWIVLQKIVIREDRGEGQPKVTEIALSGEELDRFIESLKIMEIVQ